MTTENDPPTSGAAEPSDPHLEEGRLRLRWLLQGDRGRATVEMPDPVIIRGHHHALEAVLSAADSDGVDASFLWQLASSTRRTHGTDGAAAAGQLGAPVAPQPEVSQDIELTVELDSYEITVTVVDGEDWRENVVASLREDLYSMAQNVDLADCRVWVDGHAARAYESEGGRIHIAT